MLNVTFLFPLIASMCVFLIAGPLPRSLAQARWPLKYPHLAMMLWQSIAFSGGACLIITFFILGAVTTVFFLKLLFSTIGISVGIYLSSLFIQEVLHSRQERAKHHHLLYLLTENATPTSHPQLVEYETPNNYCLPQVKTSLSICAQYLLKTLSPEELHVMILHEKAHLQQRHHWLIVAFCAWQRAVPFLPAAKLAHDSVATLTEILADKNVKNYHSPDVIVSALVHAVGGTGIKPVPSLQNRINALLHPEKNIHPGKFIAIVLGSGGLFLLPCLFLFQLIVIIQ